ncbi:16S rRNA processing protein RimM [Celeribacter ethanolicus]|uniref:Ribosome maturation factor RimM n=1 Tax=Celeribacter ethanolicus TaxID=1758178 RepID=A0A291GEY3_9RHOB|nr:ribosome maturation factor RimM [Celeribacter ethanolicus]ATG48949.1 16S rRNA processing protein RimM [Celeribacter ethanolicus]TNE69841.1 MAG: 16S rRNA processing protein RimM [Paracoccaceae bacterium]
MTDTRIIVGAIAGAFGVHGEVRIKSFCADPEDIGEYSPLTSEDGTEYVLTLTRAIKNGFAAEIEGVETKEEADALRGVTLYADRAHLPSLPDDEFYHADLIGLTVLDTGGAVLGTVRNVLNHGAGDLLEVQGPELKTPVLLPFTLQNVPTVDLASGRIIADPPDGLFE